MNSPPALGLVLTGTPASGASLLSGHVEQNASPVSLLQGLAHSLAGNPLWSEYQETVLVVRSGCSPYLAVLGRFTEGEAAYLRRLRFQLEHAQASLRYVDYEQAEQDCVRLAELLIEQFGQETARGFQYLGLPRGGLIVQGLLAYALGLARDRNVCLSKDPDVPLVVVDDCSISGARFRQFLSTCTHRPLIFAHLYSHAALRASIERNERGVTCVAARDLVDHAPDLFGDDYSDWYQRWMDRSETEAYWAGLSEYLCFSWNEPDLSLWNPISRQVQAGGRLIPPAFCFKNRFRSSTYRGPIPVIVQPEAKGPLKPPPEVIFGPLEGRTTLAHVETGACLGLSDVAADMWHAVVQHGNAADALRALSALYDVDERTLEMDLNQLIQTLINNKMLEDATRFAHR